MSSLYLAEAPNFIKERLAKSDLFNWLKDGCPGTHEKNALHISRKWLKNQNYAMNAEEQKVFRDGYLTVAAFTALGLGFPTLVLFAPSMRDLVYNTKLKKCLFGAFCGVIGYVNYNSAHQTFMYNLLQLNNSPYVYCSFQALCLPQYKRFRNKWQSSYNLSAVAHRYADFNLYQAIKHPMTKHLDLNQLIDIEENEENDN